VPRLAALTLAALTLAALTLAAPTLNATTLDALGNQPPLAWVQFGVHFVAQIVAGHPNSGQEFHRRLALKHEAGLVGRGRIDCVAGMQLQN
jgi:hypothetical protein